MNLLSTLQALRRAGPAALLKQGLAEKGWPPRWTALLAAVLAGALLGLALMSLQPGTTLRSDAEPPELRGRGQSGSEWLMEDAVGFGQIRMGLPGVASLVLFVNPLIETVPKIEREASVGNLPLLPFSAMVMSGSIWASYGWLQGSPAIWVPNCFQLLFGLHYCRVFCRFCPADAASLPLSRRVHAVGAACSWALCASCLLLLPAPSASTLLGLLGNAMNVMLFAGPLAVIRTVVGQKSTESLPFGFTCAVSLNCSLWSFYGYVMRDDPQIYVSNVIGMILGTVQLSLFVIYGFSSSSSDPKLFRGERLP